MKKSSIERLPLLMSLLALLTHAGVLSGQQQVPGPVLLHVFQPTSQHAFWPPGDLADKDGNFVVLGTILEEDSSGTVQQSMGAALVSRNTAPPLGSDGMEDFSDPLAAGYDVIRPLDLSPGSADLNMVLYSHSFGPAEGSFGGGPRLPKEGDSPFNLNAGLHGKPVCPEQFPSTSQKTNFTRKSYPLHLVPVWNFRGDQVHYEVDSGEPVSTPEVTDTRIRQTPIRLGEWVEGQSIVRIRLTGWNADIEAYTTARFNFIFRNLLPNSVYTLSLIRANHTDPELGAAGPDSLAMPNMFVTDTQGNATFIRTVPNPFPEASSDDTGLRVVGIKGMFHSDIQNWGGCNGKFGPGVDAHTFINTLSEGITDLTDFVTRPAP